MKKNYAIIRSLITWKHYLEGQRFLICTDHHSINYLKTQPQISKRQARWVEIMDNSTLIFNTSLEEPILLLMHSIESLN